jgi:prepilin peptidase CpaA
MINPILIPPAMPVWGAALLLMTAFTAAYTDIRSRRIPNVLCLCAFLAGIAMNATWRGWSGVRDGLAGFAVAFAAYFILYLLRGMAAGDVKLAGALGAIVGLHRIFVLIMIAWIAAAILGLILAAVKGRLRETLANTGFLVQELKSGRAPYLSREALDVRQSKALRMPHGVALAVASLALAVLTSVASAPR